jgi:2-oxoglutarate dehydrogenase E2 component (dihydrolipoamide succinyltransferase)
MSSTTIRMPALGESVVEGTVGKWLVQEGQRVEKDQAVVEILTDKADSEVPAPDAGTVTKILVHEGDVVAVGDALCEVDSSAAATSGASPTQGKAARGEAAKPARAEAATASRGEAAKTSRAEAPPDEAANKKPALPLPLGRSSSPPPPPRSSAPPPAAQAPQPGATGGNGNGRPYEAAPTSPSVRKLAREQGVDLQQLAGSGEGGRVTREDVLRAAGPEAHRAQQAPEAADAESESEAAASSGSAPARRGGASAEGTAPALRGGASATAAPQQTRGQPAAPLAPIGSGSFRVPPYVPRPGDEVVPLSRRRRIIADHMVYSKLTAPHVVTFAECDLHKTDKLRRAHKDRLKQEGVNLTMLAFVAAAVTRALREFKRLNARMLDDSYVVLGEVNLGIAVDTEEGLVVPVVKHADELTVRGLARAIDALALKAREGNLTPDDLAGKSFTISNPGRMGNMVGGAIISQPNVGILRIGEIKKRVVVIEHEEEDLLAIHPVMYMALSYDHRIVDGVAANSFLHRVVELIEQADFSL